MKLHFYFQAMGMLFALRDTVQVHQGTPLQAWLKRHGARTVAKYQELLKVGGVGPITFQAETPSKIYEAFIDPENKFADVDKFSQVYCLRVSCISSVCIIIISC